MSSSFQPNGTEAKGPATAGPSFSGALARGVAETKPGGAHAESSEHDAEADVPAQLRGTLVSQAIPRVEGHQARPDMPLGAQSRFQLGPTAPMADPPRPPQRSSDGARLTSRQGLSAPATTVLDTAQLGAIRRSLTEKQATPFPRSAQPGDAHAESVRVDTDPGVITHSKLKAPFATLWNPGLELQRTLSSLAQLDLSASDERLLPHGQGNPFEGLMNETLELRVTPEMLEKATSRSAPERDQVWLGPTEAVKQALPNSFGLSDEAVALAFKQLYYEDKDVSTDVLPFLGQLGRLEYRVVESLGALGSAALRLEKHIERLPQSSPDLQDIRSLLDDPDVSNVMTAHGKQLHPPKFWQDDDGSGQKAIRLIGYQLFRKRGELLRQLPDRLAVTNPDVQSLREEAAHLQLILQERTSLIRKHMGSFQPPALASSFLAQRGLNAAQGFLWLESLPESPG